MEAAPIHVRTRTYLGLLVLASAVAVVIALATLAFLGAYSGLRDVLWEDVPEALGVDPFSWYALAVTTLGGLAVGILLRVVPGHGGPGPAEGHGIGMQRVPASHAAGMVLVSLVSLAVALAVGAVLADRLKRAELEKVFGMSRVGSLPDENKTVATKEDLGRANPT